MAEVLPTAGDGGGEWWDESDDRDWKSVKEVCYAL